MSDREVFGGTTGLKLQARGARSFPTHAARQTARISSYLLHLL